MARVNGSIGRKMGDNRGETVEELLPRTAREVGTAYTHAKEGVARESYMLCFTIEGDAAGGMARGIEHLELMMAESDGIIRIKNGTNRCAGRDVSKIEPHHLALLVNIVDHCLVTYMSLGF